MILRGQESFTRYLYVYVCMYACMHVHNTVWNNPVADSPCFTRYLYVYVCMYACMHVHNTVCKNPVGDYRWAGETRQVFGCVYMYICIYTHAYGHAHTYTQVLLTKGILRKLQNSNSTSLITSPLSPLLPDENGVPLTATSLNGQPAAFDVPRVVTEDAKFLYLDGRINELEEKAARSHGDLDKFDLHIESLRKDVEDSLDHIDDKLFANLVSRVSYLKMRREWEKENSGTINAHAVSLRHASCVSVCVCVCVCVCVRACVCECIDSCGRREHRHD